MLLNAEFASLLNWADIASLQSIIWLTDNHDDIPSTMTNVIGEYETLLANADDVCQFADFDENAIATTFYTSGTTGDPQGVFLVIASWCCIAWHWRPVLP